MAMRQLQHQQDQPSSEAQTATLPADRSPQSEQQVHRGKALDQEFEQQRREFTQEQVIGVEDYNEEEEEELQEQDRDSIPHDEGETRQEASPVPTAPQAENSSVHLHSQTERQHSTSSSHFTKDPEVLSVPFMSAMPSNADLLASMDMKGSFASFPSKQVEGALQSCLMSAEGQVTRLLQQAMDTVQSQVLRALHQAASDIIEHLGKEAAHRVVVAERKAALLELELSSVKQQALSMLLRLKADSDTQALDADKKYRLERRRAQDAEAKLVIAQDASKRLKAELKKKGDILDKMQKLVQPMPEDNSHNIFRSMEVTGHLENCMRGVSNDKLRKIAVCNTEGSSFMMCNGALHQEVQCPEAQPDMEAVTQVVDDCNEKQSSFSDKVPAAGEDSLDLRKRTCSTHETLQHDQCSPSLLEEDIVSRKTGEGRSGQVELSGHVKGSSQVESLDGNLGKEDKSIEPMQDTQLLLNTNCLDEKVAPVPAVCEKNVDGKDIFQASSAAVKGFYVRRKVRENGKLQGKKVSNTTVEKHHLTVDLEHGLKTDVVRSSNETALALKTDMPEGEHQTSGLMSDLQVLQDATDSSNPGHIEQFRGQMATELYEDSANDLPEEISSSDIGKDVDLGSSTTKDDAVVETVEFARPDYEVATSLAELASIGLEVRSREMESFPHRGSNEDMFLKPGRTGLRMKRKGISFERKVSLQSEGKVSKKPRPDKMDSGLSDNHTERVLRRNRGGRYSMLKDSLSLESSRDNRRLMQGARQLLCLAEKKW